MTPLRRLGFSPFNFPLHRVGRGPLRAGSGGCATWATPSMTLLTSWKRNLKLSAAAEPVADPIFQLAFDKAGIGLVLISTDGRIQRANATFCAMLGYGAEELVGCEWKALLAQESWTQAEEDVRKLADPQSHGYDSESYFLNKGGERLIARTRGIVIGDPAIVLKVVEDMTARRAGEAALLESDERFQLAMRGANEGLFDWRIRENTTYRSPRWKAMLGYSDEELTNDSDLLRSLAAPGAMETIAEQMRRLEANEIDTYEVEMQMRHKDGRWLDILSRGFPVFDAEHRIVRLVGTHLDVTQKKQQEAQLRLSSTVLENTQEGVIVTDFAGRIQIVNPAFETLTGYVAQELKGHNISLIKSGRHDAAFYDLLYREIRTNGRWRGEIWNRRKDGVVKPYWANLSVLRDAHGEPAGYVALYSDISDFKQSQERLEFLALHDRETGLPNPLALRRRLDATLAGMSERTSGATLFHLELDRFRAIVESLGHAAGDQLVAQTITRFAARLKSRDMLARIGRDELAILREDCANPDEARALSAELSAAMAEPFEFTSGAKAYCGVDAGMVWFSHGQGEAEILMRQAESALYVAKSRGGGLRAYEPRHMVEARERLEMEVGLRHALERDELVLQFQPLVDLALSRTFGVEALVRWRSPEGLIPPGKFIPLAEKTGLIVQIGEWVMRRAAERMKVWLDAGVALDTLSINLSPRQFERPDLVDKVASILSGAGLPFDKVELEITESVLMNQMDAVAKLRQLRTLGLRIAVDDFGTGHSSLAYLKDFPIHKLKLDRAFIKDLPGDGAGMQIAQAVIQLGHSLGLTVLAEGVETEAQANFLAHAGCRYAQGFLFAKPLWEEELLPFLGSSQSVAA
jgi:PAS domain S-box-containing protein/diguanylate cyclase (GGDEF)-like protein